jgi:hypothetical protein
METKLMADTKLPEGQAGGADTGRRLSPAQLAAVVEAAYILDAVRR